MTNDRFDTINMKQARKVHSEQLRLGEKRSFRQFARCVYTIRGGLKSVGKLASITKNGVA